MDSTTKNQSYQKWHSLYAEARQNHFYHPDSTKVLIEIAAQHPLVDGLTPNPEFRARLDKGLRLAQKLQSQNITTDIYVPGSLHQHNGQSDQISLSQAGKKYLIAKGFAAENIFADEKNTQYKGNDGVYNSIDECYVATQILKNDDYQKLICVCSPAQLHRKALAYISFGVLPDMISTPCDNMFHNYINEAFKYIPDFLLHQNGGEMAKIRQKRLPQNNP